MAERRYAARKMSDDAGVPVELYVYDLTHGLASVLSPALLGHQIEGVWHTAIVVYNREYFYGSSGINVCPPGGTQLGAPLRVVRLGDTQVPPQLLEDYLHSLSASTYAGQAYQLLDHNCNNFSDELAHFLCGAHVPQYILDLPERALSPALRASLQTLLNQLGRTPGIPGNGTGASTALGLRDARRDSLEFQTLNNQVEEARAQSQALRDQRSTLAEKLARHERRRQKQRKRLGMPRDGHADTADGAMAEAAEAIPASVPGADSADRALQLEAEERHEEEERRRGREPPIVYRDLHAEEVFAELVEALGETPLSVEEQRSLDELHQYLVLGEGSWALGDDFLIFAGRLLQEGSAGVRVRLLRCLATCALRDDVSLLLHQDRRDHALMNYAHSVDRLPVDEARALALLVCNLFESVSASEWLLYISEWEADGGARSNIRATTKVAVHALLADDDALRDIGSAIVHNLATKERFVIGKRLRDLLPRGCKSKVFDDVSVELAMALLQHLSTRPPEEQLYRSTKALARLSHVSQDVPQFVQMIGPSPNDFRGTSSRIDEQIDLIMMKVK